MYKKKSFYLIFFLIFLTNCSFDTKTGIWTENQKITDKKKSKTIVDIKKITLSSINEINLKEKRTTKKIILSTPKNNLNWTTHGLNKENDLGNLSYSNNLNVIFKKKIGKAKYNHSKLFSPPIVFNETILFSDDKGTIFNINHSGKIIWKKNIYKKISKRYFKNLSYVFNDGVIYVSDNIGFLYAIDSLTSKIIWKKNYHIPFKSHIKLLKNKIYLIDQNSRIICFDKIDGSEVWNLNITSKIIKSSEPFALALSNNDFGFYIDSSGDLTKINLETGMIEWSFPTFDNLENFTKFFSTSDIVIHGNNIFFSNTLSNTFSIDLNSGFVAWMSNIATNISPIIDLNNVFLLTQNGYILNLDKRNGSVIWSTNVLRNTKKNKLKDKVSGFILASNKLYVTTTHGYLIACSALDGKIENSKKISGNIDLRPIISNEKIYILTKKSKLIILN